MRFRWSRLPENYPQSTGIYGNFPGQQLSLVLARVTNPWKAENYHCNVGWRYSFCGCCSKCTTILSTSLDQNLSYFTFFFFSLVKFCLFYFLPPSLQLPAELRPWHLWPLQWRLLYLQVLLQFTRQAAVRLILWKQSFNRFLPNSKIICKTPVAYYKVTCPALKAVHKLVEIFTWKLYHALCVHAY